MKTFGSHNYYVYITTNPDKHVLYIGVTNNLRARLHQHAFDATTEKNILPVSTIAFTWFITNGTTQLKRQFSARNFLKGWKRRRKIDLVNRKNPLWQFLDDSKGEANAAFNAALTDPSLRSG